MTRAGKKMWFDVGETFAANRNYPFGKKKDTHLGGTETVDINWGETVEILEVLDGNRYKVRPVDMPESWVILEMDEIRKLME